MERHGAIWKTIAAKVVENKAIRGIRAIASMAAEVTAVVNDKNRVDGAGELGSDELAGPYGRIEERVDPATLFGERMAIRHGAKKTYVYADSSEKVSKAILRKTAGKVSDYRAGDLVLFQIGENNSQNHRIRRSAAQGRMGDMPRSAPPYRDGQMEARQ